MKINTPEKFVNKLNEIKPDILVLENWKGSQTKIKFHCNRCNLDFYQTPNNILKLDKYGCSNCAKISRKNSDYLKKLTLTIDDVKNKNKELYPEEKYILLEEKYINNKTPMKFLCKECNKEFKISYVNFCKGKGCPNHSNKYNSKNVITIKNILDSFNIVYNTEVSFNQCKSKKGNILKFDFKIYTDDKNFFLLEYDGEFHDRNPYYSSEFEKQKENDCIKNDYCKSKNIELIRLNYKDKNIKNHLIQILNEHKLIEKHSSTIETK